MFPEPIPSPDPLDPMEGTCSHGRLECDECAGGGQDEEPPRQILIEEIWRLRRERDAARSALFKVALALEEADGGRSGTYENGPSRIHALAKARDEEISF